MTRRIIDLSHTIEDGMPGYPSPWHPRVEVSVLATHQAQGREVRKIVLGTHTATHCDAPRHFRTDGMTLDALPLDVLIGPARVIDLTACAPRRPVPPEYLATALGDERPRRLVLRFDWSDHWGRPEFYTDHPYLSPAAARWLVEQGVRLVAMDIPNPDDPRQGYGHDPDSPVHHVFFAAGVILVEYLCGLKELTKAEIELIVLPLKIAGGDGAPARCVAVEGT
ncbi:MAG: cyclase family protein [Proteobacteria bacterium]|nr:cyclase family protein [Pseudomonadota bacterium]MBU1741681.1 cyclase family protein [Pseudomonadota bacterium]